MSDRSRYRKVAAKCTRADMNRRYKDIGQLENALFRKSGFMAAAVAAVIVLASAAAVMVRSGKDYGDEEEEYVDTDTIDKIFQQATDLLEDYDSVPLTEAQGD